MSNEKNVDYLHECIFYSTNPEDPFFFYHFSVFKKSEVKSPTFISQRKIFLVKTKKTHLFLQDPVSILVFFS
jgi:hypothetical protein